MWCYTLKQKVGETHYLSEAVFAAKEVMALAMLVG